MMPISWRKGKNETKAALKVVVLVVLAGNTSQLPRIMKKRGNCRKERSERGERWERCWCHWRKAEKLSSARQREGPSR